MMYLRRDSIVTWFDTEQVVNSQGLPAWIRNLKFGIRDNDGEGWNAFWNPNIQAFDPIHNVKSGKPPYDSVSFDDLFKIEVGGA